MRAFQIVRKGKAVPARERERGKPVPGRGEEKAVPALREENGGGCAPSRCQRGCGYGEPLSMSLPERWY